MFTNAQLVEVLFVGLAAGAAAYFIATRDLEKAVAVASVVSFASAGLMIYDTKTAANPATGQ